MKLQIAESVIVAAFIDVVGVFVWQDMPSDVLLDDKIMLQSILSRLNADGNIAV